MGFFDRLLGREKFSGQWSASDPAFAAWLLRNDSTTDEIVTAQTVLGLSAVIRAVSVISTTIAGLPLRSYERDGDDRQRIPSEFDDPYPGMDGMTPFAWTETILIHLLLWRKAFLWHEQRADGSPGIAYRPVHPDTFSKVYRDSANRLRFKYRDADRQEQEVGTETITYIPGPSIDGTLGQDILYAARAVFSAAISGDKTAQATLSRGIRIGGLVVPEDGEEIEPDEGEAILESLRARVVGSANTGDIALINKRVSLKPWTPSNIDNQWNETRQDMLGEIGRVFGIPPHLLNDIEKQSSWGTGIAEQNLGLARYTLRGWSDRIEQVLSRRLGSDRFCEFDYRGLLQGTPAQEIELLLAQLDRGAITLDEYRKIQNLPPLTPAQKAERALRTMPRPVTDQQEIAA